LFDEVKQQVERAFKDLEFYFVFSHAWPMERGAAIGTANPKTRDAFLATSFNGPACGRSPARSAFAGRRAVGFSKAPFALHALRLGTGRAPGRRRTKSPLDPENTRLLPSAPDENGWCRFDLQ